MKPTRQRGVALVITLIFLSVITILAVAFLALSRRGRVAIRESTNRTITEQMADIALERAKAEMLLPILVTNVNHSDLMGPGLMVSVNYISTNYGSPGDEGVIAGLWQDPRPPVFIYTNQPGSPTGPRDFRFFLDLNRNGQFEPSGLVRVTNEFGKEVLDQNGLPLYQRVVGDPEWVGVLADPTRPHAQDNPFVGRWAYLMVPVGRTLDLNYIHNDSKQMGSGGFYRNQGFGSWEINLGAFLTDLNTNYWRLYNYSTNLNLPSAGLGFADASELLNHRYMGNYKDLLSFTKLFPGFAAEFAFDGIDGYSDGFNGGVPGQDDDPRLEWPGAPNNTNFFTVHDLWNGRAVPGYGQFVNRLVQASAGPSTYDRYTYYRLLDQLGTDSGPERRLQINLNYLNAETNLAGDVTRWLNHVASTNEVPLWTPASFFNAVGNELVRREFPKIFGITNQIGLTNLPVFVNGSTRYIFGNTNLPFYHPRIHQLLQLTANINDATRADKDGEPFPFFPTVFQPVFEQYANGDIYIRQYTNVDGAAFYSNLKGGLTRWWNLSDPTNRPSQLRPGLDFFYEIPMIVGAKKGLPNFNEFVLQTHVQATRKLELRKIQLNARPSETNQMFILGISNAFGMEGWYSSTNGAPTNYYPRDLEMFAAVSMTPTLTNDLGFFARDVLWANSRQTNGDFLRVTNRTWGGIGPSQFRLPLNSAQVVLTNSVYYQSVNRFEPVSWTNYFEHSTGNYTNRWFLTLSNRVLYFLFDTDQTIPGWPHLVDAVSLNGVDTALDVSDELAKEREEQVQIAGSGSFINFWDNRPYRNVTEGVINQIQLSLANIGSDVDWNSYGVGNAQGQSKLKAIDMFRYFVDPTGAIFPLLYYRTNDLPPLGLAHQVPFTPSRKIVQTTSWQANDPLVHYTVEDLRSVTNNTLVQSPPLSVSVSLTRDYNLGKENDRYRPWGGRYGSQTTDDNPAIKDPGMLNSDQWEFPEQKFPNVGWLGRVHRGTPWQTIYLKSQVADPGEWLRPKGPGIDLTMHPTNDWKLLDLFTVALDPDMTRGRLSINQTNLAAWSAVLAGVPVTTLVDDANGNIYPEETLIEPAARDLPVGRIVEGIMATRQSRPAKQFTELGDILSVPELTLDSPFLREPFISSAASSQRYSKLRDSDFERIPQQILSLLQSGVDEPRFVVYAFGQSLIPAEVARSGSYLGMPVNYRITGELATRAVVRIDFERQSDDPADPAYEESDFTRPHVVVERYNILPVD
jgi:hypothetical protein